jgi:hypothetical protein
MKCLHRNPSTIDIARNIAHEKNGECLSEKYINSNLPLLWCCDKGHEWNACLHSVKNHNTWCPYCVGCSVSKHTLENARKIAHSRSGKCLSEKYINITIALLWHYSKEHE